MKPSRLFRRCLNNRYDSGCCKAVIPKFGRQTALSDTKYFPRRCGIETHPDTALFSGFAGKMFIYYSNKINCKFVILLFLLV
ncbi:hypothetical protein, partial [Neisseria viridiae]